MHAALFEVESWMGTDRYVFQGESAGDLLLQLDKEQNLYCLIDMGRSSEGPKGQKELDKLENIIELYRSGKLTVADLETMNIQISIGSVRCVKVVEGDEAISALRAEAKEL